MIIFVCHTFKVLETYFFVCFFVLMFLDFIRLTVFVFL